MESAGGSEVKAEPAPEGVPGKAEAVEAGAERKTGDAGEAAEQAAEPAAIRIIEIDDGADEEAGGPVTVLEIDDSVDEEPEEIRVLEMDDADIPIDPLKDAMGRLERGGMKDGEIAELVLLADGAADKAERKRMFDKILKVLGPERQLGDGKADKILHAERILRFILETVSGGRPSKVPARRSVPPQEAGSRAPAEAQKAKC